MDLDLTEEQKMIRDTARDFATKEVEPRAKQLDADSEWPSDLVKRMGELGLMGVAVPEEHGGAGSDAVSYALAMEEICRACASTGVIMSVNNSLVCDPVYKFGTAAQKERWLAPYASGQKLGCFGLTEPMSGSDAQTWPRSPRSRATSGSSTAARTGSPTARTPISSCSSLRTTDRWAPRAPRPS